ncbi:translation initiation factor 1 (eIF-1/SUI1) [Bradyrhizobium sp. LB1.3]
MGGGVTVHGGSINIQGDASEKTVALIKAAMAQQNARNFRAELLPR